jgi:hypothetical protein
VSHYVAFLSPDYVIGIVRHGRNVLAGETGGCHGHWLTRSARCVPIRLLAQRLTKQALADAQTELSVERYLQRMTQEIRQTARQLWRCGMPMRTPHSMPARAG